MEIDLEKNLIIDNKNKYDIHHSVFIDKHFKIFFAKKRFLNFFKSDEPLSQGLNFGFTDMRFYMYLTMGNINIKDDIYDKDYKVVGRFNDELIDADKTFETLEMYRMMNIMVGKKQ